MTGFRGTATLNRNHLIAISIFILINIALLFMFQNISFQHVVSFLLLFLIWCSPGYLFAVLASRGQSRRGPFFWIVAIVSGYHLSSILTILFVRSFSIPTWMVALFISGFALATFLLFRSRLQKDVSRMELPRSGIDLTSLAVLLTFVLLFLFLVLQPQAQAGKSSSTGVVYHELFSTVFFKHVSITSELTKAELTPENPFFGGSKLNYYWLFHVFPSVVQSSLNIPLGEILFLLTWVVTVITLFAILILIHAFSTRTSDLIIAVTPLLFAYSYDGAFVLANLKRQAKPLSEFTSVNIDAAARKFFDTPEVIGIYRAFVFDPHHMFAICLMVLAFLLFRRVLHSPSRIVAGCALFLLGGIAGHSAFIAYTAVFWIGLWLLIEVLRGQASFLKEFKFLSFAALVILSYAVFYFEFPGFFQIGTSDLSLTAVSQSTLFVLVDFGALLAIGGLGLVLGIKKNDWRILPMALLLLVGFVQLFFTYFPEWPNDLSMKTGHSIYIALACLGAHFFSKQAAGSTRRKLATVAFAALALPAVPTLIMDWYTLQHKENAKTLTFIDHDDLEACEWIKKTLPRDSVVQSFPVKDGSAFYSLIPTFAERRTALGDPMHARIFQGDPERNRNRRKLVNLMFLSSSAEVTWLIAQNLGIQYIYVGTTERRLFSDKQTKFRDLNFFRKVYGKRQVRVFEVMPKENISKAYLDSYDEQTDTSVVNPSPGDGFVLMTDLDIWQPKQWQGKSGAILSLNTRNEFFGVLLFRIFVQEPVHLEVRAGELHGEITLQPGWRWVEFEEIALEKGKNKLQFNLVKEDPRNFQISEIIFFGRQFRDTTFNPLNKETLALSKSETVNLSLD